METDIAVLSTSWECKMKKVSPREHKKKKIQTKVRPGYRWQDTVQALSGHTGRM